MSVAPTEARDNMGTLGSTITDYGEAELRSSIRAVCVLNH